ncbi:MAG: carboxymuconolactone decarboxylase family protein [Deltaproteobacteria bacterium]|nr:carboxymuconolactone decarboxylase family protein [Deltaproteobacteria bacterium]
MNRITQLDPTHTMGKTKKLFDQVEAKLGAVPNLFRVLGNSPAALEGYLNFNDALAGGNFDLKVREQIALTVAESNLCGYCLSAHTFIGEKVGLTKKDIADAIHATATIGRIDAILKLARSIVVQRGEVSDSDVEGARIFGLTNGEIVETVANVVLNILTNYVNHVALTLLDFPEVRPGQI